MTQEVTVKQLLEAGVHFGHHTNRWNPKMAPFIFTDRNKVYIIDLEKTLRYLKEACRFLKSVAESGGTILFVGTKRQAQTAILEAAQRCEMPYVNQRWLGGMLTNFETVRRSVAKLDELDKMEAEGTHQFLTKKEVAALNNQREKLLKVLAGVRHMRKLPDAIFVVDPKQEEIAVHEGRRLGIPVVAIIDTNCNPDLIDYPVPGNDDAIRAVKLICEVISSAVEDGRNAFKGTGVVDAPQEQAQAGDAQAGLRSDVHDEKSEPRQTEEAPLDEKSAEDKARAQEKANQSKQQDDPAKHLPESAIEQVPNE